MVLTVYRDTNYRGKTATFSVGRFNLAALKAAGIRDNDISSLKIQDGYEVSIFRDDNFTGVERVFTYNVRNLRDELNFVFRNWNDEASSLIVRKFVIIPYVNPIIPPPPKIPPFLKHFKNDGVWFADVHGRFTRIVMKADGQLAFGVHTYNSNTDTLDPVLHPGTRQTLLSGTTQFPVSSSFDFIDREIKMSPEMDASFLGHVVRVYTDTNYNGKYADLKVGSYTESDLTKLGIEPKSISSIKITNHFVVAELYEYDEQNGDMKSFDNTRSTLTNLKYAKWNDKTTSISVKIAQWTSRGDLYYKYTPVLFDQSSFTVQRYMAALDDKFMELFWGRQGRDVRPVQRDYKHKEWKPLTFEAAGIEPPLDHNGVRIPAANYVDGLGKPGEKGTGVFYISFAADPMTGESGIRHVVPQGTDMSIRGVHSWVNMKADDYNIAESLKIGFTGFWRTFVDPLGSIIDGANHTYSEHNLNYDATEFAIDVAFEAVTGFDGFKLAFRALKTAARVNVRAAKAMFDVGYIGLRGARNVIKLASTSFSKDIGDQFAKNNIKYDMTVFENNLKESLLDADVMTSVMRTEVPNMPRIEASSLPDEFLSVPNGAYASFDDLSEAAVRQATETAIDNAVKHVQDLIAYSPFAVRTILAVGFRESVKRLKAKLGLTVTREVFEEVAEQTSKVGVVDPQYGRHWQMSEFAYKPPSERPNIGEFKYDAELSTEEVAIWHRATPGKERTVVAHRGTANASDMNTNMSIFFWTQKSNSRFAASQEVTRSAKLKYGTEVGPTGRNRTKDGWSMEITGHSLGGSLALADAAVYKDLDWVSKVVTFNPGTSPQFLSYLNKKHTFSYFDTNAPWFKERVINLRIAGDLLSMNTPPIGKTLTYQIRDMDALQKHLLASFTEPGVSTTYKNWFATKLLDHYVPPQIQQVLRSPVSSTAKTLGVNQVRSLLKSHEVFTWLDEDNTQYTFDTKTGVVTLTFEEQTIPLAQLFDIDEIIDTLVGTETTLTSRPAFYYNPSCRFSTALLQTEAMSPDKVDRIDVTSPGDATIPSRVTRTPTVIHKNALYVGASAIQTWVAQQPATF